jgi:hypothetical protein
LSVPQDAPRYTAGAVAVAGEGVTDPKTLDFGRFYFSTQGAGDNDGESIGSIFIDYDLVLMKPEPPTDGAAISLVSCNVVNGTYADGAALQFDPSTFVTEWGPSMLELTNPDSYTEWGINIKHPAPVGHSWYYNIQITAFKGAGLTYTATSAQNPATSNTQFSPYIDISPVSTGQAGLNCQQLDYSMAGNWTTTSNWQYTRVSTIAEVFGQQYGVGGPVGDGLFTIRSHSTSTAGTQTYTAGSVEILIQGPYLGLSDQTHPRRHARSLFLSPKAIKQNLGARIAAHIPFEPHSSDRAPKPGHASNASRRRSKILALRDGLRNSDVLTRLLERVVSSGASASRDPVPAEVPESCSPSSAYPLLSSGALPEFGDPRKRACARHNVVDCQRTRCRYSSDDEA